jgi:hypothetical protein
MYHVAVVNRRPPIDFYFFYDSEGREYDQNCQRARALRQDFALLPAAHEQVLYAIFVMERVPGTDSAGTWPPERAAAAMVGEEDRTHVPEEEARRLLQSPNRGLLAIPRHKWLQPPLGRRMTLFHEIGHNIDHALGLSTRRTIADFAGIRMWRTGGAHERVMEYAAEAYARFVLGCPVICRDGPENDGRVISLLRSSPAFAPSVVSQTWWQSHQRSARQRRQFLRSQAG